MQFVLQPEVLVPKPADFLPSFRPHVAGPVCLVAGTVLLVVQLLVWRTAGLVATGLLGSGIVLLAIGLAAWFVGRLGGNRQTTNLDDELPSAEEYEQLLEELDDPK